MKTFKKLLALVLAVCMLIGMPLSIDVSAVRNGNNADMVFDWRQALLIPDSWNTGLPSGRSFSLYFTGAVDIDTSKVGAVVGLVNPQGWADAKPVNGLTGNVVTQWPATISRNTNFGDGTTEKNNYVVTINDSVGSPINYKNLFSTMIASQSLKLVVRLYDKTAGVDGLLNGVTEGSTVLKANNRYAGLGSTGLGCNGNGQVTTDNASNNHDFRDMVVTIIEQNETPHLTYAKYVDGTLSLYTSAGLDFGYAGNYVTPHYIRVVNSQGLYVYTNGTDYKLENDASLEGYTVVGKWANPGVMSMEIGYGATSKSWTLNATQKAAYDACVAAAKALNEKAGTNEYSVVLAVEEYQDASDKVKEENGEALNNWYIDGLWNGSTGRPLIATHRGVGDNADRALVEIYTDNASVMADCMTLEGFTSIERKGHADRIEVTFSDPVDEIKGSTYIRVFNKNGSLMTHDPATKKLGGSSNHLQWNVSGWTKASIDGKKWIGNLSSNFGKNTYDGIVTYAAGLTDAEGKAVTAENGYQIQLAFLDQTWGPHNTYKPYQHINGDRIINNMVSTNGKKLFANNQESSTEERAVANYVDSLQITGVDLYNDNLVVITFDRDIDINKAITAINTTKIPTVWISGAEEIMNGANPICPNRDEKGHIQNQIANAQKFGNANNKLLLTGGNWTDLLAKIDTYNAKYGVNAYPILHMQGGPSDGIIPGFVGTDGSVLYNSCPKTSATWAGRYMTPVTNATNDVEITKITGDCEKNALIVEFSEPIKYSKVTADKNAGGTTTRTTVYISRYSNVNGALNLDHDGAPNTKKLADGSAPNYQQTSTGFSASDANGNKINDEYSKYWVFYFAEGAVEGAVGYNSQGNPNYDPTRGYGFAVYEVPKGDLTDAYKLPDDQYLEDFATAPDANGKSRYLRCNTVTWGHRYFKAPTVGDAVVGESAVMLSDRVVQITFSAPVLVGSGYNAIRVTPGDNNLIGNWDADYQLGGSLKAVNPDAKGYSAVWNFTAGQSIIDWADSHFFNDTKYQDVANRDLMMSFESPGSGGEHKANGTVERIISVDGIPVSASKWYRGQDGLYLSIKDDPAFDEGAVALYNGESYTSVAAAVEAANNANGGKITMIANDVFTGADGIVVAPDTVLDLAGKTLNMGTGSIVGNGHIIDSTNGAALIVMDQITDTQVARFSEENPQLPMYDTEKEGYRLFNVAVSAKTRTTDTTDKKGFGLHLDMAKAAFELMAKEGNAGASVVFTLRSAELKDSKIEVVFSAEKLAEYANAMVAEASDTLVFALWVSGLDEMADQSTLTVEAAVLSAGAQAAVTIQ